MKKLSILFFLIFLFLFLFPKTVQAKVLLWDDFNDGKANDGTPVDWEEHIEPQGQGAWWIENGDYVGTIVKECGPDIPTFTLAGEESWDDYRFEVKLKGEEGIDRLVLFRYRSLNQTYAVKMISSWSNYGDSIILMKNELIYGVKSASFVNKQKVWYKLSVIAQGPNIKIYINDSIAPIIDYTDGNSPNLTGRVGLLVWPGYYHACGSITTTRFDDVLVCDLDEPCEMPTPTPSPTPLQPLILLPGLGASWNHRAMILGEEKDPEDWYMTPGVKVYDGLIQTFQNAGYELETNLFIFNYDWRKSVNSIAEDLRDYIDTTIDPPPETEIDLIGHSLGGMVARTYVQNNSDHQVDQLITLGSPHKGAPQVYYLWEGADLKEVLAPWQRIGAGILVHLNKRGFENNVEAIRDVIPGLKDLLPTFSYLKQDGSKKPLSEMNQRNNWLEGLNQLPLPGFLTSVLNTIAGIKESSTLRWINIEDRNRFDQLLGKWEDGRPAGEEFSDGDEAVLVESAQIEGANIIEISGLNHGNLVESTDGQEAIINLLGLSPSEIATAPEVSYIPSLVFQIASPANLTIIDPEGIMVADGEKLVFIPNPKKGGYQVNVNKEDSGGSFRLLIGKLFPSGDIWQEIEGETSDEPKVYIISFDENPAKNKLELLNLAKQRLILLKKEILQSKCPFKHFLASVVKWRIGQIDRTIRLLQREKGVRVRIQIKATILSLIFLEKNMKFWTRFCRFSPEFQQELLEDIRIAKDYLLQVYEFE